MSEAAETEESIRISDRQSQSLFGAEKVDQYERHGVRAAGAEEAAANHVRCADISQTHPQIWYRDDIEFDRAQLRQTAESDQGGIQHKILGRKCAT